MPLPRFPELPDRDPVEALRLLRNYLRDTVEYFSPLKIAAALAVATVLIVGLACWAVGVESTLSWASDLVPLAFSIVGIVVSVKRLREEHQSAIIAVIVVVGILGTLVLHLSRTREQAAHSKEVTDLRTRMDAVRDQNGQLLTAFLAKPPLTSQEAEMERRQNIQKALRGEYILSHGNVSQGLLAGTELPPSDWMNRRLHELGEKWTVSGGVLPTAASAPRSYIEFYGSPYFAERREENGQLSADQNLREGQLFFFNCRFRQVGPNPVEIVGMDYALYVEPDITEDTQKRVIQKFRKKLKTERPTAGETITMPQGGAAFNSAYALDSSGRQRVVAKEDIEKLHVGAEIAFVIGQITYRDKGTIHHARLCYWLIPPAHASSIWETCSSGFNHSD